MDSQYFPITSDIELISMFKRSDVYIDGIGFEMRSVLCENRHVNSHIDDVGRDQWGEDFLIALLNVLVQMCHTRKYCEPQAMHVSFQKAFNIPAGGILRKFMK